MKQISVAIAHDYLTQRGGAERVVLALARAFPDAPIYTTLYEPDATYSEFRDLDVRTSWLNRIPFARRHHRAALPLLPFASRSIEIEADVVIASSSGWAHGFGATGRRLVYCYSPPRWLYEPDRYLGDDGSTQVRWALGVLGPWLRSWDQQAAQKADKYLAISTVTRDRIARTYGRNSEIVPAPHSVDPGLVEGSTSSKIVDEYFLVVSRLLAYKNVREIIAAFASRPAQRLLVVGEGPQKSMLQAMATSNVDFREKLSESELADCYRGCRGVIAASHEDFGLTPIEAAAYGKPSAVLRWGGFLDTIVEGVTGVYFDSPDPENINLALDKLMGRSWDSASLRARAEVYSEGRFADAMRRQVSSFGAE